MAFRPEEITKLQTLADEMAKLIEDGDNTSNNAAVAYSKIGRICVRALAEDAALSAKRTTRADSVVKFQAAAGTDAIRLLRLLLKVALRRFGLRCVSIDQEARHDD